jgi:hypothetical protein
MSKPQYVVNYLDLETGENDERVFTTEAAAKTQRAKWTAIGQRAQVWVHHGTVKKHRTAAQRAAEQQRILADNAVRAERMAFAKEELAYLKKVTDYFGLRPDEVAKYESMINRGERMPRWNGMVSPRIQIKDHSATVFEGTTKLLRKRVDSGDVDHAVGAVLEDIEAWASRAAVGDDLVLDRHFRVRKLAAR